MNPNSFPPTLTEDEVRVQAWAEVRELLELQLAPLGRRALEALAIRSGENVLDIGCGGGTTALNLARVVAPDGTVVGVDVSAAVLAFARLRPNGRLGFVCWRTLGENLLDSVPLGAASIHLPPQPDQDSDAPGPFAFANPDRVHRILKAAGFREIEITAYDERVGSGDIDSMLAVCSRVGALGKVLRENPGLQAAALPAVRLALAAHDGPDGVKLKAATWIVTARN
jgi:SAM-dependent methyltransferase